MRKSSAGNYHRNAFEPRTPCTSRGLFPVASSVPVTKPSISNVRKKVSTGGLARLSIASSKLTPKRSAVLGVPSLLNPPSSCKSGTSGRASIGGRSRKETWPMQDPSFKSECIDVVGDFLVQTNFPELKKKMLVSPSLKEFASIFNHIYCHIDSSYQLPMRFEDEVPKLMKSLGYPVNLTKSLFLNVGSMTSWTTVLAVLRWLIDIITTAQLDSEFLISSVEDRKLKVLVDMHRGDKEGAVCRYLSYLEEAFEASVDDLELLKEENEILIKEIEMASKCSGMSLDVKREITMVEQDIQRVQKYNMDLAIYLESVTEERKSTALRQKALLQDLEKLKNEIQCGVVALKEQNLPADEVKRLKSLSAEMVSAVADRRGEIEQYRKTVGELEMTISRKTETTKQLLRKYNKLCEDRDIEGLVVPTVNVKENYEIMKDEVLIKMDEIKKDLQSVWITNSSLSLEVDEEHRKVKNSILHNKNEIMKIECQTKRLNEEITSIQTDYEHQIAAYKEELNEYKDLVSSARQASNSAVVEKERILENMNIRLQKAMSEYNDAVSKGMEFLSTVFRIVNENSKINNNIITEFRQRVQEIDESALESVRSQLAPEDLCWLEEFRKNIRLASQ